MRQITEIWAYLAVNEQKQAESFTGGIDLNSGACVTFVASSEADLEVLRPSAEILAKVTGQKIVRVRFSSRQQFDTIEPPPASDPPQNG